MPAIATILITTIVILTLSVLVNSYINNNNKVNDQKASVNDLQQQVYLNTANSLSNVNGFSNDGTISADKNMRSMVIPNKNITEATYQKINAFYNAFSAYQENLNVPINSTGQFLAEGLSTTNKCNLIMPFNSNNILTNQDCLNIINKVAPYDTIDTYSVNLQQNNISDINSTSKMNLTTNNFQSANAIKASRENVKVTAKMYSNSQNNLVKNINSGQIGAVNLALNNGQITTIDKQTVHTTSQNDIAGAGTSAGTGANVPVVSDIPTAAQSLDVKKKKISDYNKGMVANKATTTNNNTKGINLYIFSYTPSTTNAISAGTTSTTIHNNNCTANTSTKSNIYCSSGEDGVYNNICPILKNIGINEDTTNYLIFKYGNITIKKCSNITTSASISNINTSNCIFTSNAGIIEFYESNCIKD